MANHCTLTDIVFWGGHVIGGQPILSIRTREWVDAPPIRRVVIAPGFAILELRARDRDRQRRLLYFRPVAN